MPTLRELQNEVKNARVMKENHNPLDSVSTILEKTAHISKESIRAEAHPAGTKEMHELEQAFGDVLVSIASLANQTGVDLEKGVNASLRKTKQGNPFAKTLKESLMYSDGEKHFVFDSPTNWLEQLKLEYPNMPLLIDYQLKVAEKFVAWMKEGKKKTLFRFESNKIAIPEQPSLPLFDSGSDPPLLLGNVRLTGFIVKPFRMVNEEDAQNQGFNSKLEFIQMMKNLYEKQGMNDDSLITIYHVEHYRSLPETEKHSP